MIAVVHIHGWDWLYFALLLVSAFCFGMVVRDLMGP